MGFYDLHKEQRLQLVEKINKDILHNIDTEKNAGIRKYFSAVFDTFVKNLE